MTNEVVLSSALRNNLLSLQRTQGSIDRAQNILSSGLRVASALDDPQSYFASQSLKNRSADLSRLLDGIGQSIQSIKAADAGVTSVTKLVEQAQSLVDAARDAITTGSKEAAVTGSVDLSAITSNGTTGGLTNLTGITTGAELNFTVKDSNGFLVTLNDPGTGAGTVSIVTGDSTDQLVTKINDLVNSATGKAVLHAELTSAGKLKITALDGGEFTVAFDSQGDGRFELSASSASTTADLALANALGFGGIALQNAGGFAVSARFDVSVTATAQTKLTSGIFYNNGATGFSDASDLLTAVDDTDSGGQVRFVSSATETSGLRVTVNGSKISSKINIANLTIQGLVDAINNDTNVGGLITAAYDATTGKFTIAADDATVNTIKIGLDGVTDSAATTRADFDFGTSGGSTSAGVTALPFVAGAASTDFEETFVFASAASTLSQLEKDYNSVREQIDQLVEDSSYRGTNLIAGDTLETFFNEDRSNKLSTAGTAIDSGSLGITEADFSRLDTIEAAAEENLDALATLRSFGSTLATSLSIIQTRETFTKTLVETLNEGSDKLVIADQNEEGAKLLALQTRQQLGITALSLASQAQQAVLRLF